VPGALLSCSVCGSKQGRARCSRLDSLSPFLNTPHAHLSVTTPYCCACLRLYAYLLMSVCVRVCACRQCALIAIMAQVGSFVPAAAARLRPLDAVLTRMGASDSLALGRSTFAEELG
jgi:hypothetical protein